MLVSIFAVVSAGAALPHGGESATRWRASIPCTVLKKINQFRADNNRRPLAIDAALNRAAQHHSDDMARNDYFSHTLRGDHRTWDENIRAYGYRPSPIGENIAAGQRTAHDVVRAWIQSPDHRANMLNPEFRAIGIGIASSRNATYATYWTTTFGGEVTDPQRC